jgi:predicted MPP superfamily phosphohydrolase
MVSRGLGTSLAPIRFGASPELAHFEWKLGA